MASLSLFLPLGLKTEHSFREMDSSPVLVSLFSPLWWRREPDRKMRAEGMNEKEKEESGVSLCLGERGFKVAARSH